MSERVDVPNGDTCLVLVSPDGSVSIYGPASAEITSEAISEPDMERLGEEGYTIGEAEVHPIETLPQVLRSIRGPDVTEPVARVVQVLAGYTREVRMATLKRLKEVLDTVYEETKPVD